jgi:transcription termination factor NusB
VINAIDIDKMFIKEMVEIMIEFTDEKPFSHFFINKFL